MQTCETLLMLDIRFIREHPDLVQEGARNIYDNPALERPPEQE